MEPKKPEKKMKPSTGCKAGNHTFIVSSWQVSAGQKKAIHLMCQHCLMPMDLVELRNAQWFEKEGV